MKKRKKEDDIKRYAEFMGTKNDISEQVFDNINTIKKWKKSFFNFNIDIAKLKKGKKYLFMVPVKSTEEEIKQFRDFMEKQGIIPLIIKNGTGKVEIEYKDGSTQTIENFALNEELE